MRKIDVTNYKPKVPKDLLKIWKDCLKIAKHEDAQMSVVNFYGKGAFYEFSNFWKHF